MEKILTILFLLALGVSSAQTSPRLYHSIEESEINTDSIRYFVLGELHYRQDETVLVQKEILDLLIKRGEKRVVVDLEVPPCLIYYIKEYMKTGDAEWINDGGYRYVIGKYLELYWSYSDRLDFLFVPMDLPCLMNAKGHINYYKRLFDKGGIFLNDDKFYKLDNRVNVERFSKKYVASENNKISEKAIGVKYKMFDKEMALIAKYGFVKGCTQRDGIEIRDIHMSSVLDSLYSEKDGTPHIVIVGCSHITPEEYQLPYTMTERISKIPKHRMLLVRVIYKFDLDNMGKRWYRGPSIEKWMEYIKNGKFDVIINPKPLNDLND